ncbi:Molecular chaperone Hsp31 and glyoxalase 3 [Corynebacterium ciconiae DSM 44920]|uniref:type 1 glutamine amidotransferase domain-containing protein n=1 Tax=Corynebacterium ciconiae TaxID=227319 RepID=UPI0003827FD3|nr:type 1 glutamine amidotransferase domain-containing protein [Corynebacterium ciconiae]WKD60135.1 Molecular chaperone Hsp31 and glyoxalase 3 [Corynebacterium ciconiae DSM 44920]
MSTRILHVVTNVDRYESKPERATGLWLSELTHAWDRFEQQGYEQRIVSPKGGYCPIEPQSLKAPFYDESAKAWYTNPERMALLGTTASPEEINPQDYDAIYFTGGHGVMFDFPESTGLQELTRAIAARGGVVAAVCHGYCGLLNTTTEDGSLLIEGRDITGFSWAEEKAAMVHSLVPYNVEEEARRRGAHYSKNTLPFTSNVVVDDRLVTGQNPTSAKATADAVVELL